MFRILLYHKYVREFQVQDVLYLQLPQFFIILQGIAGATDVSNFLRAFLTVSLYSLSSGSME